MPLSTHRPRLSYCTAIGIAVSYAVPTGGYVLGNRVEVWEGTLALMILKTLETIGEQHGYGIARRIEQTSGQVLSVNYGTLYPALIRLEQAGCLVSEWGLSESNRRARFYKLTPAGRKYLRKEEREWQRTNDIMARFLLPQGNL